MLTLTENAGAVVSELLARASETDTAGIRIQQAEDSYAVAIADAPAADEVVVEQAGARVFLDGELAEALDDMTLDARVELSGGISFALAPQPAP